jgi:hypothetical protein
VLEGIAISELLDMSGVAVLGVVAVLVITRRLTWHTDLKEEREERKRWQEIALGALGVAERTTVASEVVHDLVSNLPDPAKEESP